MRTNLRDERPRDPFVTRPILLLGSMRASSQAILTIIASAALVLGMLPGRSVDAALGSEPTRVQQEQDQDSDAEAAPSPSVEDADPAVLKERIAELEAEVATLRGTIRRLELEKLGATIQIEQPEGQDASTRVSLLKTWTGDVESLKTLAELPNVRVVYVDTETVGDAVVEPIGQLTTLNSLTLMSPQITDAALTHLSGLEELELLFLTGTQVTDAGLENLNALKNLKVLALSQTPITDKAVETLKQLGSLRALYLIKTELSDEAIEALNQALPEAAIYR